MLIRTYAGGEKSKVEVPMLSECDSHFFAGMLHLYSQIPYCHVHIVIPHDESDRKWGSLPWGRGDPQGGNTNFLGQEVKVSNFTAFQQPNVDVANASVFKAHFHSVRELFQAAPFSTQLRVSVVPCIKGCEDLVALGDHGVLLPLDRGGHNNESQTSFGMITQRIHEGVAKKRRRAGAAPDAPPRRPLYVNNINSQRLHDCYRTLYGQDDLEIEHTDIMPDEKEANVKLPDNVDVSAVFAIATSVDMQHLDLHPAHFDSLKKVTEMAVLTHINLNYNHLSDSGAEMLMDALVNAGCSIVHLSLSSNAIGDLGVVAIANSLEKLPRLTSLELCDNFIQEKGSIALAEAIGGVVVADEPLGDDPVHVGQLPVLSVDLRGNRSRELGAMRWAEVVATHPTLQFLCLARNELGRFSNDAFLGLVYAAVASVSLSVLDLRENFESTTFSVIEYVLGIPPDDLIKELLADLPAGEFDAAEVRQGVFIRRHRNAASVEKKGKQPQQGSARHPPQQQLPTSPA